MQICRVESLELIMASKFALQEGIITPSTKERLNMLESDKAEIEEQIAKEELALSKQISRDDVEYYLRRAIKSSPKILLNNLVDKVIVYDDKIEIYYKYCHKIPDDPDDQRGYFFEELRIPINCGKRNRQFLPIMIDHQKMIASVKYILNRKKKMLAPINYKKRPILASQNVTGADGYLLVETRGFANQRLLPKVNRVQPKGFTRQCRVAIFQNRNKSPLRRYKKTSRTGFNLSSLWWRCGDLNPGPPDRTRHFLHV